MNLQNRKRLTDFKKELIVARYEDGTEKAMAPHSSTYAWKVPWTEEPGRLQSMGSLESKTTERLHFHFSLSCIGEGNGNPLQCSCLENPRDGEAWWAAVHWVAQSWTRLKWLSSSSSSMRMGRKEQRIISELGMNMYTLLYLKWITNKDLFYSMWNSAQCYVAAWMRWEIGGEWIHENVRLSSFAVHLKLSRHCLLISYT